MCVPVALFGEAIIYLPLKTAKHTKGQAVKRMGAWLGTIERTEETLISTTMGVTKCRTINKLPGNEKWNKNLVLDMKGVPWEPAPGRPNQHIPVEIDQDGQAMDKTKENLVPKKENIDDEEQEYHHKTHTTYTCHKKRSINTGPLKVIQHAMRSTDGDIHLEE